MRPPGQKLVITTYLESFMKLRNQLEHLLKNLHEVIQRGETWLQEKDDGETYAQISQFLAQQMESYPSRLCNIAVGKDEITEVSQSPEQESQDNMTPHLVVINSSCTQGENDYHTQMCQSAEPESHEKRIKPGSKVVDSNNDNNANIILKDLNEKIQTLEAKFLSLQEEHKSQAIRIDTVSDYDLTVITECNSRIDTILKQLQLEREFIQSQTNKFFEQVKHHEEKRKLEFNETIKQIRVKLNNPLEKVCKYQEEFEERILLENSKYLKDEHSNQEKKFAKICEDRIADNSICKSRYLSLMKEIESVKSGNQQETLSKKQNEFEVLKNTNKIVDMEKRIQNISKKVNKHDKNLKDIQTVFIVIDLTLKDYESDMQHLQLNCNDLEKKVSVLLNSANCLDESVTGETLQKRHEEFNATLENFENTIRKIRNDSSNTDHELTRKTASNKRKATTTLDDVKRKLPC